jgi:hypothetical protein
MLVLQADLRPLDLEVCGQAVAFSLLLLTFDLNIHIQAPESLHRSDNSPNYSNTKQNAVLLARHDP